MRRAGRVVYQVLSRCRGLAGPGVTTGELNAGAEEMIRQAGGEALFRALGRLDPAIKVALMTGHPMQAELEKLQVEGLAGWLLKPPSMEQLAQLLADVLSAPSQAV